MNKKCSESDGTLPGKLSRPSQNALGGRSGTWRLNSLGTWGEHNPEPESPISLAWHLKQYLDPQSM